MIDWKREIAIAYLVKQRVAEVDSNHLWEFHLPELAATEEAIVNALVAAETMQGANSTRVNAIPHERLQEVLRRYNRLVL